ncbi:uncharacterized protein LOC110462107 [Mizuhopecten yessoensis]|uniref:Uncharacterized protein n=1 Tax=Mizuhopecten yessoensis TaxID=6573 RepID=A0A210PYU6_MIZYE|nr:uncharacterized protein LOC110462107 [Mizuhopecten yessoensis]OWF41655.1 hypothetical protein KP79_PYT22064 [Mizuhopecten yessoensis]
MLHKTIRKIIALVAMATFLVVAYMITWSYDARSIFHNSDALPPQKEVPMLKMVTSPTGRKTSLLEKSDDYVVPNIVHFTWIGEYLHLQFHHFLSIKSAAIFIRPEQIYLHCDYEPIGSWWKALRKIVNIQVVKIDPPTSIFGHRVKRPEHKSDLIRLNVLEDQGGIFLENDVIVLKPFTPLRKYAFTMGLEYHSNPGRLNNGIIVAKKNATFLNIWRETYRNFTEREWDEHSSIIPYHLQYQFPHLIHVEERSLNYPSGPDRRLIYQDIYDWGDNYAIHLWYDLHALTHSPNDIKSMNTTFGQIARYVYYNTTKLM